MGFRSFSSKMANSHKYTPADPIRLVAVGNRLSTVAQLTNKLSFLPVRPSHKLAMFNISSCQNWETKITSRILAQAFRYFDGWHWCCFAGTMFGVNQTRFSGKQTENLRAVNTHGQFGLSGLSTRVRVMGCAKSQ